QNVVATVAITSAGPGPEAFAVDISATLPTSNADYTPAAATFTSGATAGATANVVVTAVNDRLVEAMSEKFLGEALSISSSGGAVVTAAGTQDIEVLDNDSASVSVAGGATTLAGGGGVQNAADAPALQTRGAGGARG